MNIENIFKKFNKKSESAPAFEDTVSLEKYPLENEFKQFLKFSKTIEADHDIVAGKPREYVDTAALWKAYQHAFGEAAIDKRTAEYRMERIDTTQFPDDFIALKNEITGKSEYFVNRLNTALLNKIYLPPVPGELSELSKEIQMYSNDLDAIDELHNASEPSRPPKLRHTGELNQFSWEKEDNQQSSS